MMAERRHSHLLRPTDIVLSLGSNQKSAIGDPRSTVMWALGRLRVLGACDTYVKPRFLATRPVGRKSLQPFVNILVWEKQIFRHGESSSFANVWNGRPDADRRYKGGSLDRSMWTSLRTGRALSVGHERKTVGHGFRFRTLRCSAVHSFWCQCATYCRFGCIPRSVGLGHVSCRT